VLSSAWLGDMKNGLALKLSNKLSFNKGWPNNGRQPAAAGRKCKGVTADMGERSRFLFSCLE